MMVLVVIPFTVYSIVSWRSSKQCANGGGSALPPGGFSLCNSIFHVIIVNEVCRGLCYMCCFVADDKWISFILDGQNEGAFRIAGILKCISCNI